jgi:hypothetical protein
LDLSLETNIVLLPSQSLWQKFVDILLEKWRVVEINRAPLSCKMQYINDAYEKQSLFAELRFG